MQALLENQVFVYATMAILVFAITQGLKWAFVKPWTKKIKNEKIKKGINTIIYFFPYFVGIALEFAYSVWLMQVEPNMLMGAINGGAAHSVYSLYEHLYGLATGKKAKNGENKSDFEKAVEQLVMGVVEDNKVDGNDCPKLKAFMDKVK